MATTHQSYSDMLLAKFHNGITDYVEQPDPVCSCGKVSNGRCPRCGERPVISDWPERVESKLNINVEKQ